MTPPLRIAPDGARALAALLDLLGQPAPLTADLQAQLPTLAESPVAELTRLMARRRQHAPAIPATGRSPAARFLRRQHRRWRITQDEPPDPDRLARAGRRAQRKGVGWPDVEPFVVGCWLAFWASSHPARRRDVLALVSPAMARRITTCPATDAGRFWR